MVEKLDGCSPKPSEGLSEWDVTKSGATPLSSASKSPTDLSGADFPKLEVDSERTEKDRGPSLLSSKVAKKILVAVACSVILVGIAVYGFSMASFSSKLESKEWTHFDSSEGVTIATVLDFSNGAFTCDFEAPLYDIVEEDVVVGTYRVLGPGVVEMGFDDVRKKLRISFEDDAMIVEPAITSSASSEVWV